MKKILIVLLLIFSGIVLYGENIRAVYVSTWNPGLFTKKEIDKTISDAKKAKITDIFVQVRRMDEAYYNSSICSQADNLKENFDMLDYVIKEAKKNNIKIHAWFVICRIGMKDYKIKLDSNKISWLDQDRKGSPFNENNVFIDPSNYYARKYITSVISEVIHKYKVDGIHLDYIRYPNSNFGYCKNSVNQYNLETGEIIPTPLRFDNWRREQINKLVYEIRKEINSYNKNIILSASVVSWGEPVIYQKLDSYKNTFQDYEKWIKNDWVDYVMPMVYKREHIQKQSEDFLKWLDLYSKHKNKIIPALGTYLNESKGIKNQIIKTEKKGYKNWILFDFNEGKDRNNILKAL